MLVGRAKSAGTKYPPLAFGATTMELTTNQKKPAEYVQQPWVKSLVERTTAAPDTTVRPVTAIKAELLSPITDQQAEGYDSDPNFGGQEKFNGERHIIVKFNGQLQDYNREGDISKRPIPADLKILLMKHPLEQFIIDIEYVAKSHRPIKILDALCLGVTSLTEKPYKERERLCHRQFNGYSPKIEVVVTWTTKVGKKTLKARLQKERAEGMVYKDMLVLHREGRAHQHYKLKFWKDLDAVVIEPSPDGHNSVEVGVYDHQGQMHRICGVSLNGKKAVKIGDVVKVKYLYGTADLHVKEPELLGKRTDKRASSCTIDQIVVNKNFK